MITEIGIEGFKSLEKVRLKLGKFNLFVGANASGKSNFFDALRVLQGIGYGFSIDEIFDGRPKTARSEAWEPIRGGWAWAHSYGYDDQSPKKSIRFRVAMDLGPAGCGRYNIMLSPGNFASVRSEALSVHDTLVFSAREQVNEYLDLIKVKSAGQRYSIESRGPVLSSLLDDTSFDRSRREAVKACLHLLGNLQRFEPSIPLLRDYTKVSRIARLGEQGENFAGLVKLIISDEALGAAYTDWLRRLTPMDLEDVTILEGALGEPLFAVKEGGKIVPAHILSDGTLRFAALTAAFFQPDMPDIMTIEEIETGIHPTRLRLLVELLKSQSEESGPQVFATTHSPVVLAWLDEEDYETTFFCKRDEQTGTSIIKPLSEIPRLIELVKKYSLGDLFTEGWMETAF